MNIGLPHFLTVSAALFALGLFAVMVRRNTVAILAKLVAEHRVIGLEGKYRVA